MNRNAHALASAWIVALMIVPSAPLSAQSTSGGPYTIRKFVIAGGGGQPQGAPHRAAVTAGQKPNARPDNSTLSMNTIARLALSAYWSKT